MKYWIVMFRPETYAAAREHGLMGVLHMHRRRFSELAEGDRFVSYISRERILDAHGVVVSAPFVEQQADVPTGWQRYPHRVRIKFEETDAGIEAREVMWGLSMCAEGMKTVPANLLFCKGGFMKITEADYRWLRSILGGTPPASPHRD